MGGRRSEGLGRRRCGGFHGTLPRFPNNLNFGYPKQSQPLSLSLGSSALSLGSELLALCLLQKEEELRRTRACLG